MVKKIYTLEFLLNYVRDSGITSLKDYSSEQNVNSSTKIYAICLTQDCEGKVEKSFRSLIEDGGCYCKKCTMINRNVKRERTLLKNYGVRHSMQIKEVREKAEETLLKNYGCKNPMHNKDVKEKLKRTNLKIYGRENPMQNEKVKEKARQTNVTIRGVEYPGQSDDVKEKARQTNLIRRGVENPFQSEEVKEKMKQTNLVKRGVEYSAQSEEVKDKIKQTYIRKYGVKNPMHIPEIADKCSVKCYSSKDYIMPSGDVRKIQGYEHFALTELLHLEKIDEKDIITGKTNVPIIKFIGEDEKEHVHYVDIWIPSQNRMVEVKSTWTVQKKDVFLKKEAAKKKGYMYEIWVYDEKGNKITYN